jgi:hypothetical protein
VWAVQPVACGAIRAVQSDPCLANEKQECPKNQHAGADVDPMSMMQRMLPFFTGMRPPAFRGGEGSELLPSFASPFIMPGAPFEERKQAEENCKCIERGSVSLDPERLWQDDDDGARPVVRLASSSSHSKSDPTLVVGCGEHLAHPFCLPCGPNCVRNPFCGVGKSWCRVSSKCSADVVTPLNPPGCKGPYNGFDGCESSIAHELASGPPVSLISQVALANGAELQRCDAQEKLANQGVCPHPTEEQLTSARNPPPSDQIAFVRRCNAQPVQTFGSFIRHIMDAMRPEIEQAQHDAMISLTKAEDELFAAENNGTDNATAAPVPTVVPRAHTLLDLLNHTYVREVRSKSQGGEEALVPLPGAGQVPATVGGDGAATGGTRFKGTATDQSLSPTGQDLAPTAITGQEEIRGGGGWGMTSWVVWGGIVVLGFIAWMWVSRKRAPQSAARWGGERRDAFRPYSDAHPDGEDLFRPFQDEPEQMTPPRHRR